MMQQHNTTRSTSTTKLSSSASSAMAAKGKRGVINLQGPRPPPLTILPSDTTSSSSSSPQHRRPAKRPRRVVNVSGSGSGSDDNVRAPPALAATPGPLILYEHTPKVIHVHADEFKALVQRLTGRQLTPPGRGGGGGQEAVIRPLPSQQTAGDDPLVLTLGHGQKHAALPPPLPVVDHHAPPVLLPSPGGAVGGLLLSPGSFLFSPTTMQAIQELIS
jgi:MAP kinase substrate 1